jgi:hypothetical protein
VHSALITLLVVVLVASVISFVIMGFLQRRRTHHLGRKAHEMGMHFFSNDPFDVPRRYAAFALMGGGHSCRASNVACGRLDGLTVRGFDFRYELGHGTRRLTKHYGVIVAETDGPLVPVLIWHKRDVDSAPLPARCSEGQAGYWSYVGSKAGALLLSEACRVLGEDDVSVQTYGSAMMFCIPIRGRKQGYIDRLEDVLGVVRRIRSWMTSGGEAQAGGG